MQFQVFQMHVIICTTRAASLVKLPGLKQDNPHASSHKHLFNLPLQSASDWQDFLQDLPGSI